MIRFATLLGITLISSFSFAQENQGTMDTLSFIRLGYGYTQLTAVHNGDTTIHSFYPNGQLESRKPMSTGIYQRYYDDGNLMWEQEMELGRANGEMKFYLEGSHLGTLEFKNDTIIDTIALSNKHTFVFGQFTYSSRIHGGMRRPDGSSNISNSKGNKMFAPVFAVKHQKDVPTAKYREFWTDMNGYFFFVAEEGSFGIFPDYQNIELIISDMGAPIGRQGSGSTITWNVTSPIKISGNFCYLPLHVNSIGYAP